MSIKISEAMFNKLGVEEIEYAIAECPATPYADLINNVVTRGGTGTSIQYVKFVKDTLGRANYVDNASFFADASATAGYEATGNWIKLGGELVWKSLAGVVIETSAEDGRFMLKLYCVDPSLNLQNCINRGFVRHHGIGDTGESNYLLRNRALRID